MIYSFRRNKTGPAGAIKFRLFLVAILLLGTMVSFVATAQEPFDHFSTGFVLDGAHTNVTCEGCHVSATFGATQPVCVSCHSPGGIVRASSKPADHVATTGGCADCHNTSSWNAGIFMDHSSITGSCITCHNGIQATGKTPDHVSSGDQCDDCHSSTGWLPAVFDHFGVIGNCVGCHNGVSATGKNQTHITSGDTCDNCHITAA